MGEIEAAHLRAAGHEVLIDEPYQHYQFAGRTDVAAIARADRRMLHIENRTRFPDIQGFAGAYNAKRAYVADQLAERFGIVGGFIAVDHVVMALWSSEVLHQVRLREATFRTLCPDPPDRFAAWWSGAPLGTVVPAPLRSTSCLVSFDPVAGRRSRRRWATLGELMTVEPRYRGYAAALAALRTAGLA